MSYKNTFGHAFKVHTFGESHGAGLGVVIDGCPSGMTWQEDLLKDFLLRRRPGQNDFVTARDEADEVEVLSGVFEGKTLGTPITLIFRNTNQRSEDYKNLKPRQGHADQVWLDKYKHVDLRGGGRSSGRETVSRVAAGAVARSLLLEAMPQLQVCVWVEQVGEIKNSLSYSEFQEQFHISQGLKQELSFPDKGQLSQLKEMLLQAKSEGESYGGKVCIKIKNPGPGLGQPVFNKLKSDLASALFSIGAVVGVGVGVGLGDQNVFAKGTEYHNQKQTYGGIQGGLSTGKDIDLEVLMKPTSSLLDVAKKGRHDPCILPRAVVVIEAMACLVLADHYLLKKMDNI